MKFVITGHTSGIGNTLFTHFKSYDVIGFSRSNGYNIASPVARSKILDELRDTDIFINNAYNNYDDSQLTLLKDAYWLWQGLDKTIINISSRYTIGSEKYCKDKTQQDIFCKSKEYTLPYILNLKPGLVDTNRVSSISGSKMGANALIEVIEFALSCKNRFKIHSITIGK